MKKSRDGARLICTEDEYKSTALFYYKTDDIITDKWPTTVTATEAGLEVP